MPFHTVDDFSSGLKADWTVENAGFGTVNSPSRDGNGSVYLSEDGATNRAQARWDGYGHEPDQLVGIWVYFGQSFGRVRIHIGGEAYRAELTIDSDPSLDLDVVDGSTSSTIASATVNKDYHDEWLRLLLESNSTGNLSARVITTSQNTLLQETPNVNDVVGGAFDFTIDTDQTYVDSTVFEILPPEVPSSVSVSFDGTENENNLSWSDPSQPYEDPSRFDVFRATSSGSAESDYTRVGTPNTTSFTDTDIADDTTYYYRVEAVNLAGESALSAEVSTTTDIYPTPVDELRVYDGDADAIRRVSLADPLDSALDYDSVRVYRGQVLCVDVVPPSDAEAIESHRIYHPTHGVLCPRAFGTV